MPRSPAEKGRPDRAELGNRTKSHRLTPGSIAERPSRGGSVTLRSAHCQPRAGTASPRPCAAADRGTAGCRSAGRRSWPRRSPKAHGMANHATAVIIRARAATTMIAHSVTQIANGTRRFRCMFGPPDRARRRPLHRRRVDADHDLRLPSGARLRRRGPRTGTTYVHGIHAAARGPLPPAI